MLGLTKQGPEHYGSVSTHTLLSTSRGLVRALRYLVNRKPEPEFRDQRGQLGWGVAADHSGFVPLAGLIRAAIENNAIPGPERGRRLTAPYLVYALRKCFDMEDDNEAVKPRFEFVAIFRPPSLGETASSGRSRVGRFGLLYGVRALLGNATIPWKRPSASGLLLRKEDFGLVGVVNHLTRESSMMSILKSGLMPGIKAGTSGSPELQMPPFLPWYRQGRTRAAGRENIDVRHGLRGVEHRRGGEGT